MSEEKRLRKKFRDGLNEELQRLQEACPHNAHGVILEWSYGMGYIRCDRCGLRRFKAASLDSEFTTKDDCPELDPDSPEVQDFKRRNPS